MRKSKDYVVNITKIKDTGDGIPSFIGILHRHFEKGKPELVSEKQATLVAPLDLLDLVVPARLLDSIDSIEIMYRKD